MSTQDGAPLTAAAGRKFERMCELSHESWESSLAPSSLLAYKLEIDFQLIASEICMPKAKCSRFLFLEPVESKLRSIQLGRFQFWNQFLRKAILLKLLYFTTKYLVMPFKEMLAFFYILQQISS